jgi:membrane fusion protein, peptide pheromone/bacteriocin exporter
VDSADPGVGRVDVENSLEALLAQHATRGGAVYLCTLGIVAAGLVAVLTTSVDLTVRAPATLRPVSERQSLRAMSDGVVTRLAAQRDGHVRAGDTILVLGGQVNAVAHDASVRASRDQAAIAGDLRLLLAADTNDLLTGGRRLLQDRSRASAAEAAVEWRQLTIGVERATQGRDRLQQLATRGFAAPAELASAELELRQTRETRVLALERRRAVWARDLAAAEERMSALQRDLAAEREAQAAQAIVAPITGAVEELAPVSPGTSVRQGDVIAVISPDAALVADALVPARDVGWLSKGMAARLLVEGYDVQEWGAVDGVVTSIASDYTVVNDQPVFRVRVRLARPTLQRADGRVAALRKGLRCQARFLTGRRKLSQLLLRRTREWLDPASPGVGATEE